MYSLFAALAAHCAAHALIKAVTGTKTNLVAMPRADYARAIRASILDICMQQRPTHVVACGIDGMHLATMRNESLTLAHTVMGQQCLPCKRGGTVRAAHQVAASCLHQ